ncbi:unnamed protein product [Cylicocyclus nassatus]|uniref:Uncharacterized protein n=1 Tax=Cylicocyclus nassatus TaxID=53992 RepID=A0AA36GPJ4_CYLNA|nr:unnamed protein product [Cylicocyclus nassatus]
MSSYGGYDRTDFFDPTYLNQIPVAPYDVFYPQTQPHLEPQISGEPVIPYGWRPDWSRPTEWIPPTQILHTLPQDHRNTYG